MAEEKHSVYGGSSIGRVLLCPGSVKLCEGVPKRTSSYALEGQFAHAVAEHCLRIGMRSAVELVDRSLVIGGPTIESEMAEAIDVYLDEVYKALDNDPNAVLLVEHPINFVTPNLPQGEGYGKADAVIYSPLYNHLDVFDYKHGAGESVKVEDNPQAKYYACGAAMFTPGCEKWAVSTIKLHVVQPRAWDVMERGAVRSWEMNIVDLIEFPAQVDEAVRVSKLPNAPLVPGEYQCRWCPAGGAGKCDKAAQKLFEAAQTHYSDIAEMQTTSLPDVRSLDLDRISKLMFVEDLVTGYFKQVRDYAMELMQGGVEIPGWKTVEKQARRKWIGEDENAARMLSLMYGVPFEELMPPTLVGITDAERLIAARITDKAQLKEAKAQMSLRFTLKQSSGLKLAPMSDKAPAVNALQHYQDAAKRLALPAPGATEN